MSTFLAIPVFRITCNVGVDRGRAWSVIDELTLWLLAKESRTLSDMSALMDLPQQVVVASISRLMRFRLVEATISRTAVNFFASGYGLRAIRSGKSLPFFPKRLSKRISFIVERAAGNFFPTSQVRLMNEQNIAAQLRKGSNFKIFKVDDVPPISHDENLDRLSSIAARGVDEQIAVVDGKTASMREDEFLVLRVIDGVVRGLPESASAELRRAASEAALTKPEVRHISIGFLGKRSPPSNVAAVPTNFSAATGLAIGRTENLDQFRKLLGLSLKRVVIHASTLNTHAFRELLDDIKVALRRGVQMDLLWGGGRPGSLHNDVSAALNVARLVREDADTRGRINVHISGTGCGIEAILVDTAEGDWQIAVGSFNWLSALNHEGISATFREQRTVGRLLSSLHRLIGRRGLVDEIATEIALLGRELSATKLIADADSTVAIYEEESEAVAEQDIDAELSKNTSLHDSYPSMSAFGIRSFSRDRVSLVCSSQSQASSGDMKKTISISISSESIGLLIASSL